MRKTAVLVVGVLFFYGLLRDMSLAKILIFCAAIASAYAISRIPSRFIIRGKYPLIGLCLALSPALLFYPAARPLQLTAGAAILSGFYGIAVFLAVMEEKGKQLYKEVLGLSILYGTSVFNLSLTGHPELAVPLSVSVLLFLFIIDKVRLMPYVAGCSVVAIAVFVVKGVSIFGPYAPFLPVEHYLVLASAFVLLFISFITFVKKTDFVAILSFFGLIYVSVDLLLSMSLKVKGILIYQPALGLFLLGPLLGLMLKGGEERL